MTTLRKASLEEVRKLFSLEPELEKRVQRDNDRVLILTTSQLKSVPLDPLLKVEISLRKCERLGVFEK